MNPETWQILLIEDDPVVAEATAGTLLRRPVGENGQMATVDIAEGFQSGIEKLETTRYDLVVLDIRDESAEAHEPAELDGDETTTSDIGITLYEEIRRRRSVPIVFYSAVAHLVSDQQNPPFVSVVNKTDPDENALRIAVTAAIDSRLPALNRALSQHTQEVLRTYTQQFVEPHWADLRQPSREPDLAHLLARRLAVSLSDGSGLQRELEAVPGPIPAPSNDYVHPMRMYVIPPIGDWTTGDLVLGEQTKEPAAFRTALPENAESPEEGDSLVVRELDDSNPPLSGYWIMLTPACDLVEGRRKAEFVVLARCKPISDEDEALAWVADTASNKKRQSLDALLSNNRKDNKQADRYHALPPAWDVPGLVIDFQQISHVSYEDLLKFRRIATLDDPYCQAMVSRFGRYLGRLGTPDVDLSLVRARLLPPA